MKDLNDRNPFIHIHYCYRLGRDCSNYDTKDCDNCKLIRFEQEYGVKL